MRISVIGTGYVGLVTGTCFAEMGNDVVCMDISEEKILMLQSGKVPIYEPGLEELINRNIHDNRLKFITSIEDAIAQSLIIFIAVGTPPGEDGSADLKYVIDVAKSIGKYINEYKIIVNKSTVPVGTADKVKECIKGEIENRKENIEFDVVSNPEFLKEGSAIDDFMKPDRVIIGADNVRTAEIMKELYSAFLKNNHPVIVMDIKSSEMTKYASNAMLATKISFINEMANLCEKYGVNIDNVRVGIGSDSRIGNQFLYPGVGYGGSCFPKDVKAIIEMGSQVGYEMKILKSVEDVNQYQKNKLYTMIMHYFKENVVDKIFAVWGLAFKPKTDDMREAPSIIVINNLLQQGAKVQAYDPEAMNVAKKVFKNEKGITFYGNNYTALKDADALILITEWGIFRNPDFAKIKSLLKKPLVFDGRNQYTVKEMIKQGFEYFSIGR